jgi:hypothetical protein
MPLCRDGGRGGARGVTGVRAMKGLHSPGVRVLGPVKAPSRPMAPACGAARRDFTGTATSSGPRPCARPTPFRAFPAGFWPAARRARSGGTPCSRRGCSREVLQFPRERGSSCAVAATAATCAPQVSSGAPTTTRSQQGGPVGRSRPPAGGPGYGGRRRALEGTARASRAHDHRHHRLQRRRPVRVRRHFLRRGPAVPLLSRARHEGHHRRNAEVEPGSGGTTRIRPPPCSASSTGSATACPAISSRSKPTARSGSQVGPMDTSTPGLPRRRRRAPRRWQPRFHGRSPQRRDTSTQ